MPAYNRKMDYGPILIAAIFVGLFVVLLLSRMVRTEAFQDAGMGGAKVKESTANAVETFDNTGALMNLASTRVLTAGYGGSATNVRAERKAEARQVEHDLADMTE